MSSEDRSELPSLKSAPIERSPGSDDDSESSNEGSSTHSVPPRRPSVAKDTKAPLPVDSISQRPPARSTIRAKINLWDGIHTTKQKASLHNSPRTPRSLPHISARAPPPKPRPIIKPQTASKHFISSPAKIAKPPIPPRFVERAVSNRGNAWTSEDNRFIVETVTYELKRDPGTTLTAMCEKMFEQVRVVLSDTFCGHTCHITQADMSIPCAISIRPVIIL